MNIRNLSNKAKCLKPGREFLIQTLEGKPVYSHIDEPPFTGYNANTIPGTRLIAAGGPQEENLSDFIKTVLLNEKYPIRHIIVLGNHSKKPHEFLDYYNPSNPPYKDSNYTVTASKTSSEYKFTGNISEAILTIQQPNKNPIKINITILPIQDGTYITFNKKSDYYAGLTAKDLWAIFCVTQNNPKYTVVHCKEGLGRTGHLIFIFEIIKHMKQILSNKNPISYLQNILGRIRTNRPCLVLTTTQLLKSFDCAWYLYNYAKKNAPEVLDKLTLSPKLYSSSITLFGLCAWSILDSDKENHYADSVLKSALEYCFPKKR